MIGSIGTSFIGFFSLSNADKSIGIFSFMEGYGNGFYSDGYFVV